MPVGVVKVTFVFGGRTNVTPLWNVCPSVQPVWRRVELERPAERQLAAAGGRAGSPSGVAAEQVAPYAFTSANPTVLLSPSVKSPTRVPPFGLLVQEMAPSPPCPVAGFQTSHVPTLAA